ncbi:hypothetical protein OESDEN_22109 [Oesophagostomum dentatum]|uniref:Uncharacterized protein n=1 Tax=Oesophagostomum dentatum TaxID=61180 RepID=A0A0B1S309_OESDE|nr:hypothetical protein OESDEN_22109 [Oesophagostomum dentatum]
MQTAASPFHMMRLHCVTTIESATRRVFGNMTGAGMSDDDDDDENEAGGVPSDSEEEKPKSTHDEDEEKLDLSSGDDF